MNKFRGIVLGIISIIASVCIGLVVLMTGTGYTKAQSDSTAENRILVSTIGQTGPGRGIITTPGNYLQEFETGPHPHGYVFAELHIKFRDNPSPPSSNLPLVYVQQYHPSAQGRWADVTGARWVSPAVGADRSGTEFTHEYHVIDRLVLKPSTKYRIVFQTGSRMAPLLVASSSEDAGGMAGWSLKDSIVHENGSSLGQSSLVKLVGRPVDPYEDLIGNFDQTELTSGLQFEGLKNTDYAQEFRTGTNSEGYHFAELHLKFRSANTVGDLKLPNVSIWEQNDTTWTKIHTWTTPDVGATLRHANEFVHVYYWPDDQPDLSLKRLTNYRIVVLRGSSLSLSFTSSSDENGLSGWTIADTIKSKGGTASYSNVGGGTNKRVARFKIRGYAIDSIEFEIYQGYGGPSSPRCLCEVKANGDWITSVFENYPPGEPIAEVFTNGGKRERDEFQIGITNCDGSSNETDPLFRLWPPDDVGAAFSSTKLFSAKTYDYETGPRQYCIYINIEDKLKEETVRQKIFVNVINLPDHPIQIHYAPKDITQHDSMTAGKRDVQVCWVSPWNIGKPDVKSYDIRYRRTINPRPEWAMINKDASRLCRSYNKNPYDLSQDLPTIGHIVPALDPSTQYEVEVRGKNSSGPADWSPTLTFTTDPLTATQIESVETPIVAEMLNLSVSQHDGVNSFTFELHFSEDIPGLGYRTVRDHALQTRNARITGVRRIVGGSNRSWMINVLPIGSAEVEIAMPITTDCTDAGAICIEGRMLSTGFTTLVLGPTPTATPPPTPTATPPPTPTATPPPTPTATPPPPPTPTATPPPTPTATPPPTPTATPPPPTPTATPPVTPLTAEFRNVPSTHDGTQIFSIELHFSENIRTLSYVTVRDSILHTTNARIKGASRITSGSNQSWYIKIQPTTTETITVTIKESTDCIAIDTVCADDNRKLSNTAIATIQY